MFKTSTYFLQLNPPSPLPTYVGADGEQYIDLSALPPTICMQCKTIQKEGVVCQNCGSDELLEAGYATDPDDPKNKLYIEITSLQHEVTLSTQVNKSLEFDIYQACFGDKGRDAELEKIRKPEKGTLNESNGKCIYIPTPNTLGIDQMSAVFRFDGDFWVFNINLVVKTDVSDLIEDYT